MSDVFATPYIEFKGDDSDVIKTMASMRSKILQTGRQIESGFYERMQRAAKGLVQAQKRITDEMERINRVVRLGVVGGNIAHFYETALRKPIEGMGRFGATAAGATAAAALAAGPGVSGTFTGSAQLLGTTISQFAIPAIATLSKAMQGFAQKINQLSPGTRKEISNVTSGLLVGGSIAALIGLGTKALSFLGPMGLLAAGAAGLAGYAYQRNESQRNEREQKLVQALNVWQARIDDLKKVDKAKGDQQQRELNAMKRQVEAAGINIASPFAALMASSGIQPQVHELTDLRTAAQLAAFQPPLEAANLQEQFKRFLELQEEMLGPLNRIADNTTPDKDMAPMGFVGGGDF